MSRAPVLVFIDERVAATMPDEDPDERMVCYIRQDVYESDVRKASGRDEEFIVQLITNPDGHLCALSSQGRVWAFFSEDKDTKPRWILIAEGLPDVSVPPGQKLNS